MAGVPKAVTPVQLFNAIGSLTNAQMQTIMTYLGRLFMKL
jgi:hypothetical protein